MRLVLLLAFAVVGGATAWADPGGRPGEAFTFKFSLGPMESGRARMSVAKAKERGRPALSVRGQAETLPWLRAVLRLDDDYQLVVDAVTWLPMKVLSIERGMRQRTIETELDGRHALLAEGKARMHRNLPTAVRDPLSQLFALRAAPLADGERIEQDILDGHALWHATLIIHRGDKVFLECDGEHARSRAAIRIDGTLARITDFGRPVVGQPPRKLSAWLSDDDARMLLRLEADTDFGKCAVELTSYQR
jgi:hypothetical protein